MNHNSYLVTLPTLPSFDCATATTLVHTNIINATSFHEMDGDQTQCCAYCASQTSCLAFTQNTTSNHCWFYDNKATTTSLFTVFVKDGLDMTAIIKAAYLDDIQKCKF